jgi:hypothetical protein
LAVSWRVSLTKGTIMVECDWFFLSQDRSRREATLDERSIPALGDGKYYDGKNYEVAIVVTDRVGKPNPLVVAVEWLPKK